MKAGEPLAGPPAFICSMQEKVSCIDRYLSLSALLP